MKILSFSVALLCLPAFGQISPALPPPAQPPAAQPATAPIPPDTVVAIVDGEKITAAEADRLLSLFPPQQQIGARRDPKSALGFILFMRHLSDEALKDKLDQESPNKEQLEYNRIAVLSQARVNRVRNVVVNFDQDAEMKFYREHQDRYQEAKVKVIYVAFTAAHLPANPDAAGKKPLTEDEAKAKIEGVEKKLAGGADFSQLAKDESDDKDSAQKGGEFGIIKRGSPYPEEIKKTVFSLKPGQISAPLKQPNGFYLFRLESLAVEPYDQVRTQIYDELKDKGFNTWMEDVRKRYEVKVENPAYFTPKTVAAPAPPQPH